MNGAAPVPPASSRAPIKRKASRMGRSHHFLFSLRKTQNSSKTHLRPGQPVPRIWTALFDSLTLPKITGRIGFANRGFPKRIPFRRPELEWVMPHPPERQADRKKQKIKNGPQQEMGHHPADRIGQQNQTHKHRTDRRRINQPQESLQPANDPSHLDCSPMAAFRPHDPADQPAKRREPESGKLPQLPFFRVPQDADHRFAGRSEIGDGR